MHIPGSHNGHSTEALTQRGWAHSLRGRPSPNGRTVRFDGPGDKPRSYSKTLTIDPSAPGGFVVADPTGKMDWRTLKNCVQPPSGRPGSRPHGACAASRSERGTYTARHDAASAAFPPIARGRGRASPRVLRRKCLTLNAIFAVASEALTGAIDVLLLPSLILAFFVAELTPSSTEHCDDHT